MFCLLFVSRFSNHYLNPQILYVQYSIIQNPLFVSISMPEIFYNEQLIFVWITWPSLTPLLLTSSPLSAQHCSGHWSDHPSVGRRSPALAPTSGGGLLRAGLPPPAPVTSERGEVTRVRRGWHADTPHCQHCHEHLLLPPRSSKNQPQPWYMNYMN